ncbi:MAG: hypothetical protein DRQ37_05220 [Gammaproteobacteria bacterium]|nr:MAG: hypothetical protein DRQ37_05220 [Gammaproteobacteria bacterium]
MRLQREPDAVVPHVRFAERRLETELWRGLRHRRSESAGNSDSPRPTATAPVVDSTESARISRRAGASRRVMGPKSMAVAMVEDVSRAVACMNQRELAQAQTVAPTMQPESVTEHLYRNV